MRRNCEPRAKFDQFYAQTLVDKFLASRCNWRTKIDSEACSSKSQFSRKFQYTTKRFFFIFWFTDKRHTTHHMKGWAGAGGHASDTDSVSGSSCRSHESSPTTSPYSRRHRPLVASNSMNELAKADRDAQFDSSKFDLHL